MLSDVATKPRKRRTRTSKVEPRSGVDEPARRRLRPGRRRPERENGGGQQREVEVSAMSSTDGDHLKSNQWIQIEALLKLPEDANVFRLNKLQIKWSHSYKTFLSRVNTLV